MFIKMVATLVAVLFSFQLFSQADGHDKGSGGDVVACFTTAKHLYKSRAWFSNLEVELGQGFAYYEKIGNHSLVLNANLKYKNSTYIPPNDGVNPDGRSHRYFLVREGGITNWGLAFLRYINTFEFYKIRRATGHSNFNHFALSDRRTIRKELLKFFEIPGYVTLHNELILAQDPSTGIGRIDIHGSRSFVALKDIRDNGVERNYDDHCIQLQAVLREGSLIEYDKKIWDNLGTHSVNSVGEPVITGKAFQQELLQLHEELYFIGEKKLGHEDAMHTIELIFKMATVKAPRAMYKPLNDQQKINIIKSTNFWLE